ncbi:MAG: LPS export ABC transporter ATP-binding protein [Epsilonproteobacteria bacterium]|nr:MAG: LPS export ABC transporter ATP-binding protein [Campylobacterota bacterium]RLA66908.1 MAG: LPS export ABC transporter ATP-binding protein [Campylobacterota bacterium]
MQKTILKAQNLAKSFKDKKVVKDVSISLQNGEVVGLLGPNGAGKTTCFYMIVGLIKADNGNISMMDEDLTSFPIHIRAQKGIGYLPQEASIFRDLTVRENIYAALENRSIPKVRKLTLLDSLLNDFGLVSIKNSKGRSLSGGERRRVEIARALALEPKFILLDEPFAGVDPQAISGIKKSIIDLKARNIGVLITDHNVRETLEIVDRAYIMKEGELIVEGTPHEIINDERVKKYYLGENFKI